jgi:hypothetical protein
MGLGSVLESWNWNMPPGGTLVFRTAIPIVPAGNGGGVGVGVGTGVDVGVGAGVGPPALALPPPQPQQAPIASASTVTQSFSIRTDRFFPCSIIHNSLAAPDCPRRITYGAPLAAADGGCALHIASQSSSRNPRSP